MSGTCPNNDKNSNETKPEPLCSNCNELHTAFYKGCKNFLLKPKFKTSYANIVKNYNKTSSDRQTPPRNKLLPKPSVSKAPPEKAPQHQQPIYMDLEIGNDTSRLIDILHKIKKELKLDSFVDLVTYVEKLYTQIISQKLSVFENTYFHGRNVQFYQINQQ